MSCGTVIARTKADTQAEEITVINKKTLAALDITGNTFVLTVSEDEFPVAENNLFQSNGVITDAENGVVEFPITDNDAANVGNFFHSIRKTVTATGKKTTIFKGPWNVTEDIPDD